MYTFCHHLVLTSNHSEKHSHKFKEGSRAAMQETVLSVLRGVRNGAYYGSKVRAPHGALSALSFDVRESRIRRCLAD